MSETRAGEGLHLRWPPAGTQDVGGARLGVAATGPLDDAAQVHDGGILGFFACEHQAQRDQRQLGRPRPKQPHAVVKRLRGSPAGSRLKQLANDFCLFGGSVEEIPIE